MDKDVIEIDIGCLSHYLWLSKVDCDLTPKINGKLAFIVYAEGKIFRDCIF